MSTAISAGGPASGSSARSSPANGIPRRSPPLSHPGIHRHADLGAFFHARVGTTCATTSASANRRRMDGAHSVQVTGRNVLIGSQFDFLVGQPPPGYLARGLISSLFRLLSRPSLLLSLTDLLPRLSGHLPAALPRCCDVRRTVGSRPTRSLAKRRRHRAFAVRCTKRRKIPADGSYLRLKFFDSSRGTDPREFLELRYWSGHIASDHIHNGLPAQTLSPDLGTLQLARPPRSAVGSPRNDLT